MTTIDSIFSAYTLALGGKDVVLTILAVPFVFMLAIVFYKISV